MTDDRRATDIRLQAHIEKVEANLSSQIVLLDQKVDSSTSATLQGFENLNKLLDERFSNAEQRAEAANRELRQSIEFLRQTQETLLTNQSQMETRVAFLENDTKTLRRDVDELKPVRTEVGELKVFGSDVKDLKESLRYARRLAIGAVVTCIGTVTAAVTLFFLVGKT